MNTVSLYENVISLVTGAIHSPVVLNAGASDHEINEIEKQLGLNFPETLRTLYKYCNGQSSDSAPTLFGNYFHTLNDIAQAHENLIEVCDSEYGGCNASQHDISVHPKGTIQQMWFCDNWIPIAGHKSASYISVDTQPAAGGRVGQVILHDIDDDDRFLIAHSVDDFLAFAANCYVDKRFSLTGDPRNGFTSLIDLVHS